MKYVMHILWLFYLYAVAAVSLLFVAIGTYSIINTSLRVYLFPKVDIGYCDDRVPDFTQSSCDGGMCKPGYRPATDEEIAACRERNVQEDFIDAISMLSVSLPIFVVHWRLARRERRRKVARDV